MSAISPLKIQVFKRRLKASVEQVLNIRPHDYVSWRLWVDYQTVPGFASSDRKCTFFPHFRLCSSKLSTYQLWSYCAIAVLHTNMFASNYGPLSVRQLRTLFIKRIIITT